MDTKSLAPAGNLLWKIDTAIDWCKLYDLVELVYDYEGNHRPGIDPVALFKWSATTPSTPSPHETVICSP